MKHFARLNKLEVETLKAPRPNLPSRVVLAIGRTDEEVKADIAERRRKGQRGWFLIIDR